MAVAGDEVKISLLQKEVFDAAHDRSGIAVADFGNDDANREAALGSQGSGEKVGAIFVLLDGGENAIFRVLGDGVGDTGTVDDQRDCGRREAEEFGEILQTDGFFPRANLVGGPSFLLFAHAAKSRINRGQEQAEVA